MVKAYTLRSKSKAELEAELEKYRDELAQLRVAQVTNGTPSKLAAISTTRKSIAVVLTVISQTRKQHLRAAFAGKKYKPLDLRVKKTRALRRALTPAQKGRQTVRQQKKLAHFPRSRVFAVRS